MSKHTPGPWYVGGSHYGDADRSIFATNKVSGCPIPVARSYGGGPLATFCEQNEANARLIAAAPDLLEALEMAAGWIDAARESDDTGEGQQAAWILDTIRAAIGKATRGSADA